MTCWWGFGGGRAGAGGPIGERPRFGGLHCTDAIVGGPGAGGWETVGASGSYTVPRDCVGELMGFLSL